MTTNPEKLLRTAQALEATPATAGVLIGFDGFIDEIIRLVDTRTSPTAFTPIPTISAFSERIAAAAGLSCNIELVPEQIKLGGNGPIMANNLVEQGYAVTYCGALGAEGNVHPVFNDFAARCAGVISLCDPGHTDAVEFDDGKVMLGKMNTLPSVNWENLLAQIPPARLNDMLRAVELIGCVNWTMLTEMNSILIGLSTALETLGGRKKIFIDLTDPRKRSREDLSGVLKILTDLNRVADVVLGLNENESVQVAEVILGQVDEDLCIRARNIRSRLDLFQVVIHPTRSAAVATAEGEYFVEGPYTPKPRLTTGAGDNFNAGYCNGLLSGLNPEDCLITGVSSSGFYVRNCRSATRAEQIDFLRAWSKAGGGDMP